MSYRKRPWAVYGKVRIIKVDRKHARTGCSFPREKGGKKKKLLKETGTEQQKRRWSQISFCALCIQTTNKQKIICWFFFLDHGKKKAQLCKPFNFLSRITVKNTNRSRIVDFLRAYFFLLTEFDWGREASRVCSLCYLLQETDLTHKIIFCIK